MNDKQVVHVGVTRAPTEDWAAQQLRDITPFGEGSPVLIRDGDTRYGAARHDLITGSVSGYRQGAEPIRPIGLEETATIPVFN